MDIFLNPVPLLSNLVLSFLGEMKFNFSATTRIEQWPTNVEHLLCAEPHVNLIIILVTLTQASQQGYEVDLIIVLRKPRIREVELLGKVTLAGSGGDYI